MTKDEEIARLKEIIEKISFHHFFTWEGVALECSLDSSGIFSLRLSERNETGINLNRRGMIDLSKMTNAKGFVWPLYTFDEKASKEYAEQINAWVEEKTKDSVEK